MATESALFLLRRSGEGGRVGVGPSLRFKLPSELGVKILVCERDASVPAKAGEDMRTAGCSFKAKHYPRYWWQMQQRLKSRNIRTQSPGVEDLLSWGNVRNRTSEVVS